MDANVYQICCRQHPLLICQEHESHCVWLEGTSQKQKELAFILASGKLPVKVSLVSLNKHLQLHPPEASRSAPLGLSPNEKGLLSDSTLKKLWFFLPHTCLTGNRPSSCSIQGFVFICLFFNGAKCLLCFPTASDLCWREQILAAWSITRFSDGFPLPYALVQ